MGSCFLAEEFSFVSYFGTGEGNSLRAGRAVFFKLFQAQNLWQVCKTLAGERSQIARCQSDQIAARSDRIGSATLEASRRSKWLRANIVRPVNRYSRGLTRIKLFLLLPFANLIRDRKLPRVIRSLATAKTKPKGDGPRGVCSGGTLRRANWARFSLFLEPLTGCCSRYVIKKLQPDEGSH